MPKSIPPHPPFCGHEAQNSGQKCPCPDCSGGMHALVVLLNDSRVDVTLHPSAAEALRAAAKRVFRMMRESSALDLGDEVFRMSEASEREDWAEVVFLFEAQARRKVVFIQPVQIPEAGR